jgi:hypothetical protein
VGSRELSIMTTMCHKHPLQADVGNTKQPTMGGEQGGNNGNKSPVQQTLDEGASSPKSVPRPPSPPPCSVTKTPAIH